MDYADLGRAILEGIKKIIFWKKTKRYIKYRNEKEVQDELERRKNDGFNNPDGTCGEL